MENYLWLFATAGGAAILGLAIAYAVMRQKRLDPVEKQMQDDKVKHLYHKH
jgi:hypothetical protein